MATLVSRGYNTTDQADFVARSVGPHTLRWKADAYRWQGAGAAEQSLLTNIPIIGGTLTLDSSDPTRRKLSLEVGGGEALVPRTSDDPLVPFGQMIRLWCTIDRPDGTAFPWLLQGEFPIQSYVYERPSLVATVDCQDLSARVNEFLHLGKHSYKDLRLDDAIVQMVKAALPNKGFAVHATAGAQGVKVVNYVADAGTGRWDAAVDLAEKKGYETFFDSSGNLVIRNLITGDDDDVLPGVGPDIGTVSNPVAVIRDGVGGSLVGLTATVTREGGCNYVRFNLTGTVTQRAKKQNAKKPGVETKQVDWTAEVHAEEEGGPADWGDKFGFLPIVREFNLGKVTEGEKAGYQKRANNVLHRRRGVIRYIDFDMVGGYWLEPDDRVRLIYGSRTEDHYIQSVQFDLAGKTPTRVRTRQLAVVDPG